MIILSLKAGVALKVFNDNISNSITGFSLIAGSSINSSSMSPLPILRASVSGVLDVTEEERENFWRSRSNGEVDLGTSDDSLELRDSETSSLTQNEASCH